MKWFYEIKKAYYSEFFFPLETDHLNWRQISAGKNENASQAKQGKNYALHNTVLSRLSFDFPVQEFHICFFQ